MLWTLLDWVIIGILALSSIFGLFRGFSKEIISFIAWLAAFYISLNFSGIVAHHLEGFIPQQGIRVTVSVVAIFIVVILVGCIFNAIVHSILRFTGFGIFDRLLGLVFGAARGAIIVVAGLIVIQMTSFQNSDWAKQSQLAPHFQPLVSYAMRYMPVVELQNAQTAAMSAVKKLAMLTDDVGP